MLGKVGEDVPAVEGHVGHAAPPGPDQDRLPVLDLQLPGIGGADLDRLLRPDPQDPLKGTDHGAAVVVLSPPIGGEDQQAGGFSHLALKVEGIQPSTLQENKKKGLKD
jgi:CheY-like chemotaxis protein